MRTMLLLAAGSVAMSAPAQADTACEWMDFAEKITKAAAPPPDAPRMPEHSRATTHAALAMFEAVNAIDRRYESYLGLAAISPSASQEAAAVTAVYQVLLSHFPSQKKDLDGSYLIAMQQLPEGSSKSAGKAVGETAATYALRIAAIDPDIAQKAYRPRTTPGVWVPTDLPQTMPWSVAFKPWILPRANAVRPAAPPSLTSRRYAKDFEEVKRLGSKNSKHRTEHQTLMARYRITPDMMPALRLVSDQSGRKLVDNARLFALHNMISDDVTLAMADAKLHYNYWRPITAIRNAGNDGNPATTEDPDWEPLIRTPNHGEYPCGHCLFAGATGELMKAEYGDKPAAGVRVGTSSIQLAAIQVLPSWDKWVEEVSFSRTLGGVHYRFSNEAGEQMGRAITRMAISNIMRPLPQEDK